MCPPSSRREASALLDAVKLGGGKDMRVPLPTLSYLYETLYLPLRDKLKARSADNAVVKEALDSLFSYFRTVPASCSAKRNRDVERAALANSSDDDDDDEDSGLGGSGR